MEIINNRKPKEKTFKDLPIGQVFIDGDGDVCMKIDNTDFENSIILKDGNTFSADFNAFMIPVKATLIIEGDE